MATALSTLIDRTRRYVQDWPNLDTITASVTSSGTTLSVADSSIYAVNNPVELDQETMIVRALPSSTTLTVFRGAYSSTAASHASSTAVLVRPQFYAVAIIDGLNAALDATYPLIYKDVLDTSLTTDGTSYEYTVPNLAAALPIPYIAEIDVKLPGDLAYREYRAWEIRRGAVPKIKFRRQLDNGTVLRVHGYGPFPHLATTTDALDAQWPFQAEPLLPIYAAAWLLGSGEARRVRVDVNPVDQRENANRTGSSMGAANALMARFYKLLADSAMPAIPRHVRATF